MIISGNNNRSISTQSGGVMDIRVNFQKDIGDFDIGLSGDSFFGISCREGLLSIYDEQFGSINNGSKNLKVFYSNNFYNLYDGSNLLINGGPKPTGVFENLFISTNSVIDCDVIVSGKEPVLDFTILNGSNSGNTIVSGFLANEFPDRRFLIFDASVDVNSSSKFAVTGWDSGICDNGCLIRLVSLENTPTPTSGVKIDFISNFGPFSVNANIPSSFVDGSEFFSVSPNQNTFFNSAGSKLFNVTSFFQGPDRNLQVELSFVSGGLSSQIRSLETGIVSGNISGMLKGCGTMNKPVVNYLTDVTGLSGYIFSGNATGKVSKTYCHTGQSVWTGSVLRTGLVYSGSSSGQIYSDYINVNLTGTVLEGSGYYVFQNTYTGVVTSGGVNIDVTGNLLQTGYLYSSEGRIAGIGTQLISEEKTTTICGDYDGATSILENKNYFYNEDGWSGFIPTFFTAYHVPTGYYSELINITGSGLIPNSDNYFSGVISGTATGLINTSSGCDFLIGSLTGLHNYEYIQCVERSGVYVGDVAPTVTALTDYYGVQSGNLYEFKFSQFQDYLMGSGKPCSVWLSGWIYDLDPFSVALDVSSIAITISDRQNNTVLQTGFINEFERTEVTYLQEYEFRNFSVYKKNFTNLTGFNFTGEINISGRIILPETSDPAHDMNFMRLFLVPYSSGVTLGQAPITGDYGISRCLTGTTCVTGTGLVEGAVSGVFTLLEGTGVGSGRMLGPEVPIPFVDMWNLKTGIGNTFYDYKESGWFEGSVSGKFSNSGGMTIKQNIFNSPLIEVYYDRSLNLAPSIAKLSVYDGYNLEEIFISGR